MDEKQHPPSKSTAKTILITGGTSGLGASTAQLLATHFSSSPSNGPIRIYLTSRRPPSAALLTTLTSLPNVHAEFIPCDLASLSSVASLTSHLLASESHLDILVANAGVAAVAPTQRTKEGYEIHFGTNHLGHALLVRRLLPLLTNAREKGRVVFVTSAAFKGAAVSGGGWRTTEELDGRFTLGPSGTEKEEAGFFGGEMLGGGLARWARYAESKMATVVYARELARRVEGVVSVSASPGFVETEMVRGMRFCDRLATRALGFLSGGMVTPEEGARNQVWAATVEEGELVNGGVYEPVGVQCGSLGAAADEKVGEVLWEWTEKEIAPWMK